MVCCMLAPGAAPAETGKTPPTSPAPATKPYKSPEERFTAGQACLKQSDIPCAQIILAGINPSSGYAKILEAQIAANRQDFDTVLRLLIPLQAENGLLPAALGSLHATLALAYENQENPLRALEQRSQADSYLETPEESDANQKHILQSLTALPKESLLEMRGESSDTVAQGWIDLALAIADSGQRDLAIRQWRQAYPDHPASEELLRLQRDIMPAGAGKAAVTGKIALLLPLEIPTFAFAADAVRGGFMAAKNRAQSAAEIVIYPTHGIKDEIPALYRQAVAEGAQFVVGPLTRAEVAGLNSAELVTVPTIALNTLDEDAASPAKLVRFGLPLEEEASQLARLARTQGMQTAIVAVADSTLAKRMAQAFAAEWTEQGGAVVLQAEFSDKSNLLDVKAQIAAEPADMIFLAADAEKARQIRPYLDQAMPTFGLSHIYDGDPKNPLNGALNAIHFIDMPWLLNPDAPEYAYYRETAASFPPMAQRWFAVGVDAWNLLSALSENPAGTFQLRGLTGNVSLRENRIVRELQAAQFRNDGVFLE